MTQWRSVHGTVVRGHRVASGACNDPRFPGGTIALQKPLFLSLGLNLAHFYSGTINLSIAPLEFKVIQPHYQFRNLRWTEQAAAEDFSFFDCRIVMEELSRQEGLIYYPHPETKPDHFQAPDTLEILTYPIPDLGYGKRLTIELSEDQIELIGQQ